MRRCIVHNLMDRIFTVKECRRLLQRPVLCLHDKEPQKDTLACKPAHVHKLIQGELFNAQLVFHRQSDATYIVLPPQRVQRNRVHVLIKDERERDHKVEDTEAFGPEVERQDLDRV